MADPAQAPAAEQARALSGSPRGAPAPPVSSASAVGAAATGGGAVTSRSCTSLPRQLAAYQPVSTSAPRITANLKGRTRSSEIRSAMRRRTAPAPMNQTTLSAYLTQTFPGSSCPTTRIAPPTSTAATTGTATIRSAVGVRRVGGEVTAMLSRTAVHPPTYS